MAKKALLTVDSVHRKVKKGFITDPSVHRKIKKAFITVGGVWRPCWSANRPLSYYGTITPLDEHRYGMRGATVGNYAVFHGGIEPTIQWVEDVYDEELEEDVSVYEFVYYYTNIVYAYDKALTQTSDYTGSAADQIQRHAATTVGNYALFGGGKDSNSSESKVRRVNGSLTWGTVSNGLSFAVYDLAATTVGDYAVFAGGYGGSGHTAAIGKAVTAYNSSLSRTLVSDGLSVNCKNHAAASVGDYALFAGGYNNSGSYGKHMIATVDAYDTSLTKTSAANLSVARRYLHATTVGGYALFAGGDASDDGNGTSFTSSKTAQATVDVYNASLTRISATPLSVARYNGAATTLGDYALFGGGVIYQSKSAAVDAYDTSLTRTTQEPLPKRVSENAAASVGNYALFAGGYYYAANYESSLYQDMEDVPIDEYGEQAGEWGTKTVTAYTLI